MKLDACSEAGWSRFHPPPEFRHFYPTCSERAPDWMPFVIFEEWLRGERGRRAIVVVSIAHPVRVELELAVVEVEVRRVLELAISIRKLPSPIHGHCSLILRWGLEAVFYLAVTPRHSSGYLHQAKASSSSSMQRTCANRDLHNSGCILWRESSATAIRELPYMSLVSAHILSENADKKKTGYPDLTLMSQSVDNP